MVFCISTLPFAHGERRVRGAEVIPRSVAQLVTSILIKALPLSYTNIWRILKMELQFCTASVVRNAEVLLTEQTWINPEKKSTTSIQC